MATRYTIEPASRFANATFAILESQWPLYKPNDPKTIAETAFQVKFYIALENGEHEQVGAARLYSPGDASSDVVPTLLKEQFEINILETSVE